MHDTENQLPHERKSMSTDLNLKEEIERLVSQASRPLPLDEACRYLNCSKSYLYKLTCKRRIPHYKPNGKKLFFKTADLDQWLLQNPVKTGEQIELEAINRVALS